MSPESSFLRKEHKSCLNSYLSYCKNLTEESPGKSYKLIKSKNSNAFLRLSEPRLENTKNISLIPLNIDFIRNKITSFKEMIGCRIWMCLHLEAKIG